jgi:hypothetical protein
LKDILTMTNALRQLIALREQLMNSNSIDRTLRMQLLLEVEREIERQLKVEQVL